jgi:hypothetical protein
MPVASGSGMMYPVRVSDTMAATCARGGARHAQVGAGVAPLLSVRSLELSQVAQGSTMAPVDAASVVVTATRAASSTPRSASRSQRRSAGTPRALRNRRIATGEMQPRRARHAQRGAEGPEVPPVEPTLKEYQFTQSTKVPKSSFTGSHAWTRRVRLVRREGRDVST